MTKYKFLTGSMSLCLSCLNLKSEKCPKFRSPSGRVFDAEEYHDVATMFGGITIQDCSEYAPDKSKLPAFALQRLLEIEEEVKA